MIAITVKLTCRSCGVIAERLLNLQEGIAAPTTFTCAACNLGRSATDGLSDAELVKHPLAKPETKRNIRLDMARKRTIDWPRNHPLLERVRRIFRPNRYGLAPGRTRRQRSAYWTDLYEAFVRKVEALGWACYFCAVALDTDALYVGRLTPGSNALADLVPSCRSCSRRQAARLRWERARKLAA